ncbi:MAG: hypothetical protein Ct9H300mP7_6550 [Verrucomicrobiota bacterium]|nr:MAG: hypothetical protein Ct9H300mP7_6550 [Verrucomicrobiota bacterium]
MIVRYLLLSAWPPPRVVAFQCPPDLGRPLRNGTGTGDLEEEDLEEELLEDGFRGALDTDVLKPSSLKLRPEVLQTP